MFPVDEPEEILTLSDVAYSKSDRRAWDCYYNYALHLWCEYDGGDVVVSLFDENLHRGQHSFLPLRVLPSQCRIKVSVNNIPTIPFGDILNAVDGWLELNIDYWNSVKDNDIRNPLPCPPDVSFLD